MKKIILIDNYDSFTFNLYHYLSSLKVKVDVIRNDQITSNEILKRKYNKIVISPGPGNPDQSGNCLKIVKSLYKKIPFELEQLINASKIYDTLDTVEGRAIIYQKILRAMN